LKAKILTIALLLSLISLFHYFAPPEWRLVHTVMGHAYLVPIVIASYWFALKGGLISSICAGILFAPHIPFQFRDVEADKFIELFVYTVIGVITGILSGKLQRQAEEIYDAEERLHTLDRFSSVGELAASVAHEIRNPLGSIKGAIEILQDDFPENHEKGEFLEIIQKEVNRLNRIAKEFLDLARQRPVVHRYLNLSELVRSVAFLVSFKARKRKVELGINVPARLHVRGDADHLKQAILNIMLNAVEAVPGGGEVVVSAREEDSHVVIEISDTGPGIPEEIMSKVFEPFFTTKGQGTGLGLSISGRIVREHGGEITARSPANGQGTIIIVTLPLPPGGEDET